jgi:hypothetical protein
MPSFRSRLAAAFRSLRKQGVLAKANYECCGSCAGYALTNHATALVNAGTPKESIKGCVHWNRQRNAGIYKRGEVVLNYGPLESTTLGTIGLPAEEVGRMVVTALQAEGVRVEWDGSGDKSITALDPERPEVSNTQG